MEVLLIFCSAKSICLKTHLEVKMWVDITAANCSFQGQRAFFKARGGTPAVSKQNLCARRRHQWQQDGGGVGGRVQDGLSHPGRAHQAGGGHRRVLRVQGSISALAPQSMTRCLYFGRHCGDESDLLCCFAGIFKSVATSRVWRSQKELQFLPVFAFSCSLRWRLFHISTCVEVAGSLTNSVERDEVGTSGLLWCSASQSSFTTS